MERKAVFSVREVEGVWLAEVSQTYPIDDPERKTFTDFQQAYDWSLGKMPKCVLRYGTLHGMFYICSE